MGGQPADNRAPPAPCGGGSPGVAETTRRAPSDLSNPRPFGARVVGLPKKDSLRLVTVGPPSAAASSLRPLDLRPLDFGAGSPSKGRRLSLASARPEGLSPLGMEPVWWAVGLFEAGGTLALVGEGVRASLGSPAGCPRTLHRFKGAVGMGTLVGGEPRGCDWVLSPKGNEVNKILKFINLINGRLITLKYNLQLMEVIKFVNHKYGTHIVYLGPGAMAPNNS